jgi:Kef-type K+ transport system membrane component KefB
MKLLNTRVGVVVLSAGVGNDVTAWILLALCVTLVNASSGLTALWILLVAFGYVLLLTLAVRPGLIWLFYRTRSIQNGPSQTIVAFNLLLVMASAFFTSIIGIHPIFGAFLVGVITPHDGGFARKLAEKIEDLVSSLFLPLYFALSGLSTNIGLLDTGIVWAYTIVIIVVAFVSKAGSATLAARVSGMVWRESFTVGALMSCKGLVELIVLVGFCIPSIAKLIRTEHWSQCPDSHRSDIHNVRRHGAHHNLCHCSAHIFPLSNKLPGQDRGMETWRD